MRLIQVALEDLGSLLSQISLVPLHHQVTRLCWMVERCRETPEVLGFRLDRAPLGFPAPLSALQVPQGLEMCWVLLGHPCLQRGLGNLGLHGHQHLGIQGSLWCLAGRVIR